MAVPWAGPSATFCCPSSLQLHLEPPLVLAPLQPPPLQPPKAGKSDGSSRNTSTCACTCIYTRMPPGGVSSIKNTKNFIRALLSGLQMLGAAGGTNPDGLGAFDSLDLEGIVAGDVVKWVRH